MKKIIFAIWAVFMPFQVYACPDIQTAHSKDWGIVMDFKCLDDGYAPDTAKFGECVSQRFKEHFECSMGEDNADIIFTASESIKAFGYYLDAQFDKEVSSLVKRTNSESSLLNPEKKKATEGIVRRDLANKIGLKSLENLQSLIKAAKARNQNALEETGRAIEFEKARQNYAPTPSQIIINQPTQVVPTTPERTFCNNAGTGMINCTTYK